METPALPEIPAGMKMYRLSVSTRRMVTTLPMKKTQTVEAYWILGDLPGVSPMHVVDVFWKNVPHRKPGLLDQNGTPVAQTRMKRSEIIVEEIAYGK